MIYVDTNTGEIFENIDHLRTVDDQLVKEKFGKLSPILFSRIQTIKETEVIPVTIWVLAKEGESLPELELAAKEAILSRHPDLFSKDADLGKVFDVEDTETAKQLEEEYNKIINDEMVLRITPMLLKLQASGYDAKVLTGIPMIFANLTKDQVLTVNKLNDVAFIDLAEAEPSPEMEDTTMSLNVDPVWSAGIVGGGSKIVILEAGNVDLNHPYLNVSSLTLPGINGVDSHPSHVASVAASYHGVYTGVAPSAEIISIGHDNTFNGIMDRLSWLYNRNGTLRPYVINFSEGTANGTNQLNNYDRGFDYWARLAQVLIVKPSGNSGTYISHPGLGWNVFTVGAANNNNTEELSDDIMYSSVFGESSYINPVSDNLDREKPEILAFGQHIDIHSMNPNTNNYEVIYDREGTSLAAPMVSGLSALLQDRHSSLQYWPEVQKAIIMASAINNIDGPPIITDEYDLHDGAGAIDVGEADEIAQNRGLLGQTCTAPCWWGRDFSNETFPVESSLDFTFNVTEPSLVRIVITWWSNPDQTYNYDTLDIDLDLWVRDQSFNYITSSTSYDNNYEMVSLGASPGGNYHILVSRVSGTETSNHLGIAVNTVPFENHVYIPLVIK